MSTLMSTVLSEDDVPHPPLKKTPGYYAALIIVIPVWAITPASWIFLGVELWRHGIQGIHHVSSLWEKIFILWAFLEVLFSIYHYIIVAKLSRGVSNIVPSDIDNLRRLYSRILHTGLYSTTTNNTVSRISSYVTGSQLNMEDVPLLDRSDPRAVDFRQSLRTWFRKSPWSTLTRAHMSAWISWSMFNASFNTLSLEQKRLVSRAIDMMERRAGSKFSLEADDPASAHVKPLRLTLDPMSTYSRPAIAYAVINFAALACREWYRWRFGVRYEQCGDLEYLIRDPVTSAVPGKDTSPILFLHGLGVGMPQYHLFISYLLSNPVFESRTIVVLIQPHISQSLFHPRHLSPLNKEKTIRDLRGLVLRTLNNNKNHAQGSDDATQSQKVVVLSHSFGSVPHGWLLKAHPELIERSCFVDPIIFCLWEGDICYNFVYKTPSTAIELLMRYYVGSELGIAYTIQRNFDWSANTLFFEEIPNALDPLRTIFVLGGNDSIVASDRVRRYFAAHGITPKNFHYDEKAAHGEALVVGRSNLATIIAWLEKK